MDVCTSYMSTGIFFSDPIQHFQPFPSIPPISVFVRYLSQNEPKDMMLLQQSFALRRHDFDKIKREKNLKEREKSKDIITDSLVSLWAFVAQSLLLQTSSPLPETLTWLPLWKLWHYSLRSPVEVLTAKNLGLLKEYSSGMSSYDTLQSTSLT